MTEGISGSNVRGCGRRASISAAESDFSSGNRDRLRKRERPSLRAAQRREMRAAAGELAKLMRHRPHIAAGGDVHFERCCIAIKRREREVVNADARRLHRNFLALPRQLVRGNAIDLFRGEDRRHLIELAVKARGDLREAARANA